MLNKRKEEDMWQGWINLAAGIWLIICGFVPGLQKPESMFIAGIVTIVFGFWGAGVYKTWQGTVNGIIGIWLFLSAVWFGLVVPWNFFVLGIILAILAIWNLAEHPMSTEHTHAHAH